MPTTMTAAEARKLGITAPKRSKYRNKPVVVDGVRFDSEAEAKRWMELKHLERAGLIGLLRRQVSYDLKAVNGEVICRYKSDFDYHDCSTGQPITEDVKGVETRDFKIKAKLFAAQYGREIRLVKP